MQSKLPLFIFGFFFSFFSFANDPLILNDESTANEFISLSKIENIASKNESLTLEQLELVNPKLFKQANLSKISHPSSLAGGELPANIPAFWWGCCLSWVGILLVFFLTDKDQSQTKKALYGCITLYGVIGLVYVILIAVGVSTELNSGY
jgi:hypothetical protein